VSFGTVMSKEDRKLKNNEIYDKVVTSLSEKYPDHEKKLGQIIHDIQYDVMRDMILSESKRLDGRGMKDVRAISSEVSVLPRTHGSALFTRGQTQSLTTVTLGTKRDEQIIEGLKDESSKRFILHYNFPPFSTGEVGGRPGPGRREIGHGNLAERSLKESHAV
jgi:polyribonucleotide nucleotidyltransferase